MGSNVKPQYKESHVLMTKLARRPILFFFYSFIRFLPQMFCLFFFFGTLPILSFSFLHLHPFKCFQLFTGLPFTTTLS